MILGMEYLEGLFRVATIVVPVALYFFLLGLLNTRTRPQLLTGRQDFALLTIALSPLILSPLMALLGGGSAGLAGSIGVLATTAFLLRPRGHSWVMYNLSLPHARKAAEEALQRAGLDAEGLDISSVPVLRNVSLRLDGISDNQAMGFERNLASSLQTVSAEPLPAAVGLLLVATAMLVAPLALMAQQMPQIVRLLTDLLP